MSMVGGGGGKKTKVKKPKCVTAAPQSTKLRGLIVQIVKCTVYTKVRNFGCETGNLCFTDLAQIALYNDFILFQLLCISGCR